MTTEPIRQRQHTNPVEDFKEELRLQWAKANYPTLSSLATTTGLSETAIHQVLRSKIIAPWKTTEQVLRVMGVRDGGDLERWQELHESAAVIDRSHAATALSDLTRLEQMANAAGGSRREAKARSAQALLKEQLTLEQVLRLTQLFEEQAQPETDLSWIKTDQEFLGELRKLQAAAGDMSLRNIEKEMRRKDPANSIGKTTISKYLSPGATELPKSHPAVQVQLLVAVLLEAAPPDRRVSARQLREFMTTWQRLKTMRILNADLHLKESVEHTTSIEVEVEVEAPSISDDHEAAIAQMDPDFSSRTYKSAATVILVLTVFLIVGATFGVMYGH